MTAIPAGANPERPTGRLAVTTGLNGRWVTVEARGDLDMTTAAALEEQITAAAASGDAPWIALELSGLAFCDSAGLNVLIRAWKQTAGAGGRLVLLRPQGRVTRLLQITGLDRRLDVADALPD